MDVDDDDATDEAREERLDTELEAGHLARLRVRVGSGLARLAGWVRVRVSLVGRVRVNPNLARALTPELEAGHLVALEGGGELLEAEAQHEDAHAQQQRGGRLGVRRLGSG